jgi:voltage-gated potassium channel
MARQTRIERWLDRQLARTKNPRQAAVVIAVVSTSITVVAGLLMTVVDHGGFPSLGSGLWWAVQTVTTVGYGDHVPTTVGGQLLAALVMLLGIGFITVITAAITSSFISRARLERPLGDDGVFLAEQFKKIDERLERIEAAVCER